MAEVCLYHDEAQEGDLPQVCICCGDPDAKFEQRSFVWYPMAGMFIPLVRLFTSRRLTAQLPFCRRHGGGLNLWASNPRQLWGLRPTHMSADTINIAGVSEEFVDELERYRDGEDRPRRRSRGGRGDDDFGGRRASRNRRRPRPMPTRGAGWGGATVLLVLLCVVGVVFVSCAGLVVVSALIPRPARPPLINGGPVAIPEQAGNHVEPGNFRAEDAVAWVGLSPQGFPNTLPWAALQLTARTDLARPPSDAEVNKALQGLKDRSPFTVRDAAKKLAKMAPVEKHRKEVAKELLAATTRSHGPGLEAALQALGVWGTAEEVPALAARLEVEHNPWSREAILATLAAIKDASAIEAIARRLGERRDRDKAAAILSKLGPIAEKAVVPYLKDRDQGVRLKACEVLQAVGTVECEADLGAAAKDPDPGVAAAAERALATVKARQQEKKPAEGP